MKTRPLLNCLPFKHEFKVPCKEEYPLLTYLRLSPYLLPSWKVQNQQAWSLHCGSKCSKVLCLCARCRCCKALCNPHRTVSERTRFFTQECEISFLPSTCPSSLHCSTPWSSKSYFQRKSGISCSSLSSDDKEVFLVSKVLPWSLSSYQRL